MRIIFKIKEFRKQKNMTLKELSKKSGVSTSHIGDVENNEKMPSILCILRIAKGLGLKQQDIYKLYNVYW